MENGLLLGSLPAGTQEIASVVLSLGNLAAHVHNGHLLRRNLRGGKSKNPYAWLWWLYLAACCNSWLWSALFHARDTYVTERLDYLSADCVVAVTLFVTTIRVFALRGSRSVTCRLFKCLSLGLVVLGGLALHLRYMLYIKFDYGWNMACCVACGAVSSLLWLGWVLLSKHPGRSQMVIFILCVNVGMLLEVLDFPPIWGIFDAHSLWHAVTIPLTYVWYSFILKDHMGMGALAADDKQRSD